MGGFRGFPAKSRQTPVPNVFFSAVLPMIDDLGELKVALQLFSRLAWKKGYPRFVTMKEMSGDLDLMSGLALEGRDPTKALADGLRRCEERGTFLHLALERKDETEHLYFLNTDADRRAIERVERGEVDLGALPKVGVVAEPPERRSIYELYEENIGVLSPLIADDLKEAEDLYPYQWIVDAFREAVGLNRRRWRYIQRILENWQSEGKTDGEIGRRPPAAADAPAAAKPRGGYIVKRRRT